ncbi:type II toxin-antitoxin system RelE/ParE family toxin, partial [Escherichia coli]
FCGACGNNRTNRGGFQFAAARLPWFAKKLKKCSENPHIPSAKLRGLKDCYKIKLRASGFRLVYQVIDDMLIIAVVAVGKRERSHVYNLASERMR